MNGIKVKENEDGSRSYELHWEGAVEGFDDYGAATRALVEKMRKDASGAAEKPQA